ncbi:hypothetical protein BGZ94_010450, partial [Podila epigama]
MVASRIIAALMCAVALVGAAPVDPSAGLTALPPRPLALSAKSVSHRIVAIGDIHSDIKAAVDVLRLANLIDANENWIGGKDTLVSTGDLVDRGHDTIAVYKLFQKLRPQAAAAGGEIVNLLG